MIKCIDNIYDEFLGIRTEVEVIDSHHDRSIYYNYEPTKYSVLEDLFRKYPFDATDHIVDFGCGKGRVLIMAAYYSCKHITGYELDIVRYGILIENIKYFKHKFGNDSIFSTFNMNVEKINIVDTSNKFFFFNPFHLKVYIKVMNAIHVSLQRKRRDIYIYLHQPLEDTIRYFDSLDNYKRECTYEIHYTPKTETDRISNKVLIEYSNRPI